MDFKADASVLSDFFSQPGRGFYVPKYQRPYSWDMENAERLIDDLIEGTERLETDKDHAVFLGTLILHRLDSPKENLHFDVANLITRVDTVVDGQQRIASLALLSCLLTDYLIDIKGKLDGEENSAYSPNSIESLILSLDEIYSLEVKTSSASPRQKPIIIREDDSKTNPVTDQWTEQGDIKLFYKGDIASFISKFINSKEGKTASFIGDLIESERIRDVVDAFRYQIDAKITKELKKDPYKSSNEKTLDFFKNFINCLGRHTHFVVIETKSLDLAYDMFQSLNATGTPLTSFEVFKPRLVQACEGDSYKDQIEPEVRRIEDVIGSAKTSEDKQKNTADIIHISALTYDGSVIAKKFTSERKWLEKTLDAFDSQSILPSTSQLVQFIADQADYWDEIIRPRNPKKNSSTFTLVNTLGQLGLNVDQSNKAAFCIFYLKDSNHSMAHTVLSTFFSKLKKTKINTEENIKAASDFYEACLATAAFFTLWKGGGAAGFPDQDYRDLFAEKTSNMSVANGEANQNINFLREKFRHFLHKKGIYDISDSDSAEDKWVLSAKDRPWYRHKASTRFGLFAAAQDSVPGTTIIDAGLYVDNFGKDILEPTNWFSENYGSIEHIANQTPPINPKYPGFFDKDIYPDLTNSQVDKIGNLTLINQSVNSSVPHEWPEKAYYYWSMTTPSDGAVGITDEELKNKLRITSIPPLLAALQRAGTTTYSQILAPIVVRAQHGLIWDLPFINKRSEHLCRRIFKKLDAWLR